MKNSKDILLDLQRQVTLEEDLSEIRSILYLVMEHVLGVTQVDIVAEKHIQLSDDLREQLEHMIQRINNHEPIQYILESCYFHGRKFRVSSAVLIPRPETEILIEEALKEIAPFIPGAILDIGTGSGCIAITLAKEAPEKRLIAIDVSPEAIKIAKANADQLDASVEFHLLNVLTQNLLDNELEMIVSNPPYIATSEKGEMKKNVLNFEPHLALFVTDQDPLIFYRTIAEKGFTALKKGGKVLVEINERFGKQVSKIFFETGYNDIRIIKDLQQKDRIVFASKK